MHRKISPRMSRSCLGLVSVASWSCLGLVSVMSRCCFGDVSVMSRSYLGLLSVLCGDGSVMFMMMSG